jgi:hypothetical protein
MTVMIGHERVPTFNEFLTQWSKGLTEECRNTVLGTQRMGQFLMNVLHRVRPDLYRQLTNTDEDPFYRDDLIPDALAWLEENW